MPRDPEAADTAEWFMPKPPVLALLPHLSALRLPALRGAALAVAAGALLAACATGGPEPGNAPPPAAYAGALEVRPDPVRFEPTPVGCTRAVELTLANTAGDAPLAVRRVTSTNADLGFAARLPLTLEPGEEVAVALRHAPRSPEAWSGQVRLATDEAGEPPYVLGVSTAGIDPPENPLDLVFVLDVSTTMDEIAPLRAGILELLANLESDGEPSPNHDREADPDRVRLGLVTFENDVVVHAGGRFLDRDAFLAELDAQLVEGTWTPDPELPRHLLNFDLPENLLDALYLAGREFAFREDARRYLLAMTDATFLEPPAAFSDGTPALHSYDAVAEALASWDLRLVAVSPEETSRGLATGYEGRPSLPSLTGGAWFDLAEVRSGALAPGELLRRLVQDSACAVDDAPGR